MVSLKKKFKRLKIKYKLMVSYWPIVFFLVVIMGILFYITSSNIIKKQSFSIMEQTSTHIANEISQNMKTYQQILDNIIFDTNFNQYAAGMYSSTLEEYRLHNRFTYRMELMLGAMDGEGIRLSIIRYDETLNESLSGSYHNKFDESVQITAMNAKFQLVNRRRMTGRKWFDEIYESEKAVKGLWKQVEEDTEMESITLFTEVVDTNNFSSAPDKIALVEMTVPLKNIFSFSSNNSFPEPIHYAVVDIDRQILFSHESLEIDEAISELYYNQKQKEYYQGDKLYLITSIPDTAFFLLSAVPTRSLQAPAKTILRIVLLAILVFSILIFLISYGIAENISRRINILCESMLLVQRGDLGTQVPLDDGDDADEIGYLAIKYNRMSEQIKSLVEDVYIAKLDKKEADLRALQAQINPHFLYNSLTTVIRLSELNCHEDINTLVRALVNFYRMTLNKSGETVSVAEEILQIKSYLEIYKIRMGEYFTAEVFADETTEHCKILPITIQPFVENVFKHGIWDNGKKTSLFIGVLDKGDTINIVIEDDGMGMDKAAKEAFLKKSEDSRKHGYGARNVNERIKLYFGEQYGVSMESEVAKGTRVLIVIPKVFTDTP